MEKLNHCRTKNESVLRTEEVEQMEKQGATTTNYTNRCIVYIVSEISVYIVFTHAGSKTKSASQLIIDRHSLFDRALLQILVHLSFLGHPLELKTCF